MRFHIASILIGFAMLLVGHCQGAPKPGAALQVRTMEISGADVAWAAGWNIWKLEGVLPNIRGVQVVILDEKGTVISGGGDTLAVNPRPGHPSVLRVAAKIDGRSVAGRVSANDLSVAFERKDAFEKRHTAVCHAPKVEGNMIVLVLEHGGKSARSPVVRRLALRLLTGKEIGL
ncbi:MAG: hypothetical protein HN380_30140 [Victivallales bacterium]|jgi:hypothetical protein|nr:hypothetical protein [Victivallales bacterium]